MVDMFGAEIVEPNMTSSCADIAWVRFPGSGYEIHFLSTPQLASPTFNVTSYVEYVDALYGNLSEVTPSTYDQFMDFHLGTITSDMTQFYTTLKENDVPFFMVGQYPDFFDLFVEIPGTGAIFEITSDTFTIEDVPIYNWNICQTNASPSLTTTGAIASSAAKAKAKARRQEQGDALPVVNWRKTTYAAPHPALAELFTIVNLDAQHTEQGHPGVWVRHCAKIAWTQYNYTGPGGVPFQFHFVDGYSYPPYDTMNISQFATLEEGDRDFDHDNWDEWANNHLTLWVEDLAVYLERLDARGVSYVTRRWTEDSLYSVVVDFTSIAGHVLELVSDQPLPAAYPQPAEWDFCRA